MGFCRLIFAFLFASFSVSQCLANQSCGVAAVGDLNGDGKPDVVVAEGTLNTMGVFFNTGSGSFGEGTFHGLGTTSADSLCLAADGHNSDHRYGYIDRDSCDTRRPDGGIVPTLLGGSCMG